MSPSLPLPLFLLVPFLLLLLLFVSQPSTASLRHRQHSLPPDGGDSPTLYLEVTKPINHPKTKPCSYLLLHHDFGYTYGKSPVLAPYNPPTDCPAKEFSTIVLEWSATCKGRQFDRIFGVWLGGVELLRSCTAEPRPNGIVWKVEKDVTRYYSLLMSNQTLAVYLGNLVTSIYTGVYHVDISIHFYPYEDTGAAAEIGNWADLVLPISRNLPLNDGLWLEIENSTDTETKEFAVPPNAFKAVLEVYVSFHEKDEFWYTNLPNDYIAANNLSGADGNGPFREVLVTLDDHMLVGAVWPFTVIYTGGVNPLLWRPITGIGSFDLPTYDIELTPLLWKLLDGMNHKISFSVTNALNVWYVDANLHLWLDKKSSRTVGQLLSYHAPCVQFTTESHFLGLNGAFVTRANRSISYAGWVRSSHGKITTTFNQELSYFNLMEMGDDGNVQIVNQTIEFNSSVFTKMPSSHVDEFRSYKSFPLCLYSAQVDLGGGGYNLVTNLSLGFYEDTISDLGYRNWTSSLKNLQEADGVMTVQDNLVVRGLGSTRQMYDYGSSCEQCYMRNISSSNYTVLYNRISTKCSQKHGRSLVSPWQYKNNVGDKPAALPM